MCLTWPLKSRDGFCAGVKKERGHRLAGIICRNRKGSAKKRHIGWVFVIASPPPRWMAAAAVRTNSCRPEKVGKNKLHQRRRARWGESHAGCETLCNREESTLGREHAGLRIGFIGKHICSEAHFPVCSEAFSKTGRIWGCAVVKY